MILKVYRLTNKVTHARAVVLAESEYAARRIHPTNAMATRRDGRWCVYRSGGPTGGRHGFMPVSSPPGWPMNIELVHADLLAAQAHRMASAGCEAYQASLELRAEGEGPDASWGGRCLEELL